MAFIALLIPIVYAANQCVRIFSAWNGLDVALCCVRYSHH